MVESETAAAPALVPAQRSNTIAPGSPAHALPDTDVHRDDGHRFGVVLRGYERTSVDAHVTRTAAEIAGLRYELAESERRRALAEQHATATEGENRALRAEQHGPSVAAEESFGFRAEKLLRLAEGEATDMRTTAAREAAALLERARAEAEHHRHEVEQALIARSALLDQQATQRTAELQEREQQLAAQLAAARSEVEQMHQAAQQAADQERQQLDVEAESIRNRAAQEARRLREQAEQEVVRLGALRDSARAEITRLAELLADGLGSATAPPGASGSPASGRRALAGTRGTATTGTGTTGPGTTGPGTTGPGTTGRGTAGNGNAGPGSTGPRSAGPPGSAGTEGPGTAASASRTRDAEPRVTAGATARSGGPEPAAAIPAAGR